MKNDKQHVKENGFWSLFLKWLSTPFSLKYHFSRSDPRIMIILFIIAVLIIIFGDRIEKMLGSMLLWYLIAFLVPALWAEKLCKRFGSTWGMIIALTPIWLPILLLLTSGFWMPILGIH